MLRVSSAPLLRVSAPVLRRASPRRFITQMGFEKGARRRGSEGTHAPRRADAPAAQRCSAPVPARSRSAARR